MPQSSAQREPSMEEILASIRRIIEDSDSNRQDQVAQEDEDSPAIDAFRSEFRESANDAAPFRLAESSVAHGSAEREDASEPAPPRSLTMAEIEADLTGSPRPRPVLEPVAAPAVPQEPTAARSEPATKSEEPQAAPAAGAATSDLDEDLDLDRAISSPLAESSLDFQEQGEVEAQEETRPEPAAPRSPIISEQTGRQVAAAFGELSEAFAASRRRSFDEMAEEMLRPMLQDWLDNNLPTLVEKLVREEIERIARGAQ